MPFRMPANLTPTYHLITSSGLARIVLVQWHRNVLLEKVSRLQREVEGYETEVARLLLETSGSAKEPSIWRMKKSELQEVALQEMGMPLVESEGIVVPLLRDQIRRHRDMSKATADPLATLPKHLQRRSIEELRAMHAERGLAMPDKDTKVAYMQAIRDDCTNRKLLEKQSNSQWTQETEATSSANGQDSWDVVMQGDASEYGVPTHSMDTPRARQRKTKIPSQSSNA